jgi:thiamine-phosphate pyrophosphorylase
MYKKLPNLFVYMDHYNDQIFKNSITNLGIIYRNYSSLKKEVELTKIAQACKKKRYKLYVSNDLRLAMKVKADGIYIPSFNKSKNFMNLEKRNLCIIGSAHNQKEIKIKIMQKCSALFIAPIFSVEKKKNFLNIHKFNFLSRANKINTFALGGINEKNISKLKLLNIKGYAGIRMFKKKPAYKRPVF